MPSPSRSLPAARHLAGIAGICGALLLSSACAGDPEPGESSSAGGTRPPTESATTTAEAVPEEAVEQPPLPADPSGYTPAYVQTTLTALTQDYRDALLAYQAAGAVDDTVSAALANVYHPDVLAQQIRNLEDYYPGGENLENPVGAVQVEVTGIDSVSADCILAVTTYDVDAVTTLDAPAEDDFFIGLARNPADADGTRPWLITVEYSTSDGEPLPEDACA